MTVEFLSLNICRYVNGHRPFDQENPEEDFRFGVVESSFLRFIFIADTSLWVIGVIGIQDIMGE